MSFIKFLKENIIGIIIIGIITSLASSYIYENYILDHSEDSNNSFSTQINQNNSQVKGHQRNIEVNDNGSYIEGDKNVTNNNEYNYIVNNKELEKTSPYELTEEQAYELAKRLTFNSKIEKDLVKKISIEGQPPIIVFLNYVHDPKEDFVIFNVSKFNNEKWTIYRKDTIRQQVVHFYHRLMFFEESELVEGKSLYRKDVKIAFVAPCIQRHQCDESGSVIVYYPNVDKLYALTSDKNGNLKLPYGLPNNPKDIFYFEYIAQQTKTFAFFGDKILRFHVNLSKMSPSPRMLPNYLQTIKDSEIDYFRRMLGFRNGDDYRIIGIYLDDILGDGNLKWIIHAGWNTGRESHWGADETEVFIKDIEGSRLIENVVKGYKEHTGMHGHSFEVVSHLERGIPHLTFFYIDGGNSDFYFSNVYEYDKGTFSRKKDEALSQKMVTTYYPNFHYNHY